MMTTLEQSIHAIEHGLLKVTSGSNRPANKLELIQRMEHPEQAAASLWFTPTDLARLIVEILKSLKNESNLVLSQEITRQTLVPQMSLGGLSFGMFAIDTMWGLDPIQGEIADVHNQRAGLSDIKEVMERVSVAVHQRVPDLCFTRRSCISIHHRRHHQCNFA